MRVPYAGAPRVPRYHRHITPLGWLTLGMLAFWVAVILLLARCA